MTIFSSLTEFNPTRTTLHTYSQAMGTIPRTHAIQHPNWWHLGLKLRPDGLVTDNVPLPNGRTLALRMDLLHHKIVMFSSGGDDCEFDMTSGLTSTQMGNQIIAAAAEFGLEGAYAREKFENDDGREYNPEMAAHYFQILVHVERIFNKHKATLPRPAGPTQIWPHGFDMAFEWFGTHTLTHEEHGQTQTAQSQINLGFYPGSDSVEPYFFSNPWPFAAEALLDNLLPPGTSWHTEGWEGTIFPYAELVGDTQAEDRLLAYAQTVFNLAAPTLDN
ncbi:MAG: hypothetical protein GY796_32980 [Chloroflexi bacterium]|nr:hypothetical protein [Chloroflexota bacterium]